MVQAESIMHLAFAFDQNFVVPFNVLLTSVFSNNKGPIVIHAIATGVDEETREQIKDFVKGNESDIIYYEIDEKKLANFVVPQNSYFTVATYYRLFFPLVVSSDVKRILYIDTDTVVIGDLWQLYNQDLQGYSAAAVRDSVVKCRPDLGVEEENYYFNAGVLLIDTNNWLLQNISDKSINYLHNNPDKIKWVDQDALNAILYKRILLLDGKYNVTFNDIPANLPKSAYSHFLKDKIILHYTTGLHKPWSALGENKFRYIYHDYLKKSPYSQVSKYKDLRLTKYHLSAFLRIRLVEFLLDYPKLYRLLQSKKH